MPTKIELSEYKRAGIEITWIKTKREIAISGWYDSGYGCVEGERMPLGELFARLGITEKECIKAIKEYERDANGHEQVSQELEGDKPAHS